MGLRRGAIQKSGVLSAAAGDVGGRRHTDSERAKDPTGDPMNDQVAIMLALGSPISVRVA